MYSIGLLAVVILRPVSSGNLLLGKPSTHSEGNDGSTFCFHTETLPVSYWQVDLQGYYDIHNISITTCWGSWGTRARSAAIEVSSYDPVTCPDPVRFLYGITPPGTGSEETHSFEANPPFPVRFLRVSATIQPYLSAREVTAFGSGQRQTKVSTFQGLRNKQVMRVRGTSTVESVTECGVICHMTDTCLVFSFKPNMSDNCVLSDCPSATDATNWITMVRDL